MAREPFVSSMVLKVISAGDYEHLSSKFCIKADVRGPVIASVKLIVHHYSFHGSYLFLTTKSHLNRGFFTELSIKVYILYTAHSQAL